MSWRNYALVWVTAIAAAVSVHAVIPHHNDEHTPPTFWSDGYWEMDAVCMPIAIPAKPWTVDLFDAMRNCEETIPLPWEDPS